MTTEDKKSLTVFFVAATIAALIVLLVFNSLDGNRLSAIEARLDSCSCVVDGTSP